MRFQPRLDFGDLLVDNGKYKSESDLYMRRLRLSVSKDFEKPPFGKRLWTQITFDADKLEKSFDKGQRKDTDNDVNIHAVDVGWSIIDEFGFYMGYEVPPYYRYTSSGKYLVIEKPSLLSAAEKAIGGELQTHVMIFGDFAKGAIKYSFAYGDGASDTGDIKDIDSNSTGIRNKGWGDLFSGRIEFALPGLVETRAFRGWDDTTIGGGDYLVLGIGGAFSGSMRYKTAAVANASVKTNVLLADISGRYRFKNSLKGAAVTGQIGYVKLDKDYSYRQDEEPKGYYIQAGFLIPKKMLFGHFEPVARYEDYDHDKTGARGTNEKIFTIGFNHYISKHSIKWGYNFVQTNYDRGVREAKFDGTKNIHQLQFQYDF
jgi:hypothetical protein